MVSLNSKSKAKLEKIVKKDVFSKDVYYSLWSKRKVGKILEVFKNHISLNKEKAEKLFFYLIKKQMTNNKFYLEKDEYILLNYLITHKGVVIKSNILSTLPLTKYRFNLVKKQLVKKKVIITLNLTNRDKIIIISPNILK